MSPFDLPPSTPPASFDPPETGRRSRRRTLAVAAASIGLVAGGALVVSQLASADESQPVARAATPGDETIGSTPPTPAPTTAPPTEPDDDAGDATTELDGQIVIRINDDEPIVIDLGQLGELGVPGDLGELGELGEIPDLDQIEECLGHPLFDIDIDAIPDASLPDLPMLDLFTEDGGITITGPDGVSVLDFGDGDGSVTITKENGEITVTSEGDVVVNDLGELLDDLPQFEPGEPGDIPTPSLPDFQQLFDCLESAG